MLPVAVCGTESRADARIIDYEKVDLKDVVGQILGGPACDFAIAKGASDMVAARGSVQFSKLQISLEPSIMPPIPVYSFL